MYRCSGLMAQVFGSNMCVGCFCKAKETLSVPSCCPQCCKLAMLQMAVKHRIVDAPFSPRKSNELDDDPDDFGISQLDLQKPRLKLCPNSSCDDGDRV